MAGGLPPSHNDLEGSIGTILVANNFVNILATSLAAAIAIDLAGEGWGPILSSVVVTILVLVVGEVTPKTLAARRPERYGLIAATPIWALSIILRPISRIFIGLGRVILRLFRIRPDDGPGVTGAGHPGRSPCWVNTPGTLTPVSARLSSDSSRRPTSPCGRS